MRRQRRSYPQHAFPLLSSPSGTQPLSFSSPFRLSKHQKWLLGQVRLGARILLDMNQKRALLYSFRRGIEELAEITLRALSRLVKMGFLTPAAMDGRVIHYSYSGA